MLVYKRAGQQTFSDDFQVRRRRFSSNTEATTRKDAEAVERVLKVKARVDIEAEKRRGNGPLLLRHAAGRYWEEIGQYHRDYKGTWHALELLWASCCSSAQSSRSKPRPTDRFASVRLQLFAKIFRAASLEAQLSRATR